MHQATSAPPSKPDRPRERVFARDEYMGSGGDNPSFDQLTVTIAFAAPLTESSTTSTQVKVTVAALGVKETAL